MTASTQVRDLDLEHLRETTGGDPEFLLELAELYRSTTPRLLGRIGDAAATADLGLIRQHAHTLKGASANVGALRMRALSSQLETVAREGRGEHVDELVAALNTAFVDLERELERLPG
jgi:HPt (histidine-containing phosphotransfer) domain-containing protein